MIRNATLAGALTLGLLTTGCLGPNNAHNGLRNWNAEVSEQDWVCEVVFLGMNVVPVYGIALLADVLVLNTIDYWSGDNPVDAPGPFPHAAFGHVDDGEDMAFHAESESADRAALYADDLEFEVDGDRGKVKSTGDSRPNQ